MLEVVLDTETTGLKISEGHRIVEIGCIELKDLIPTQNRFHCYLNPERKVSEDAFKVHGYSDTFLSNQKKFKEIADEFLNFIYGKRLVIHNAEFDLSHLNNELALIGKKKLENEIIDTLILARDKFPGSPVSLDALCKRFGVDNSRRKNHTALMKARRDKLQTKKNQQEAQWREDMKRRERQTAKLNRAATVIQSYWLR